MTEAYNENLLVEQSMMLTEALWQMKRKLVFVYSSVFVMQYAMIIAYIVFGMANSNYSFILLIVNTVLTIVEIV